MKKSLRRHKMLGAIHIKWGQMRPDIRSDKEALAGELRNYAAQACELANVESLRDLTDKELGWVLDAMNGKTPAVSSRPPMGVDLVAPGSERTVFQRLKSGNVGELVHGSFGRPQIAGVEAQGGPAEITHLASPAQAGAAEKLFQFIGWDQAKQEQFLMRRGQVRSFSMLTFRKANGLIRVLLNIAVSKQLKRQVPDVVVSRKMIDAGIPDLKRRLDIR